MSPTSRRAAPRSAPAARNGSIPDGVRLTPTLRASPRSPVTSSTRAESIYSGPPRSKDRNLPAAKVPRAGTRWKLACALFAGLAGYSMFFRHGAANTPAAAATARSAAIPFELRRPLHVTAESAGISRSDLVDRVLRARSLRDIVTLTEKLGAVGDDQTIDQLAPLVADARRGVPEAILACYGSIGTEHAVDTLIGHVDDDRPQVRAAAITALGATQSAQAEKPLLALAGKPGDPAQATAIAALGTLGSDGAIGALIALATSADPSVGTTAVAALGSINSEAAATALRRLVDAPDPRIAAAAITAIDTIDEALLGKLTGVVRSGDPQLVAAALGALAKAGGAALPVLRVAATSGSQGTRSAAITAIGEIGGSAAIQLLGELLITGDRTSASSAAGALAAIGGKEAREILINAALGDRGQISGALAQLAQMEGDDVDQALLSVMRSGSGAARRAALPRLVKAGNPDAIQLAIGLVQHGVRQDREEAIRLLADSGVPRAFDALVDIAGTSRGQTRVSALDALAQARPGDPGVTRLLHDPLFSGRREAGSYAASVLSRLGTEPARQILLSALSGKSSDLAEQAAAALLGHGMTDAVKTALLSAAQTNPAIKRQVMDELIQAGDREGLRFAEDLLSHPDPRATSAIYALAAAGTPEASQLLERALVAKDAGTRIAAMGALLHNPDDHATDTLVRMTKDQDPQVRAAALSNLGTLGSERAQQAIFEATRSPRSEDRVAAISGLSSITDDPRASAQLATLIRDPDLEVAETAISVSYSGGPEVDQALVAMINDPAANATLRAAAARRMYYRASELDPATRQSIAALLGNAIPEDQP
ncbi:MAG: hypothetical protein E6J90_25125 [Deltaproteobacteria bacterium]|nr:MAG: hypothetical protein E6J90_25125 [Deltaproteobacteria bacterium]